MYDLLSLDALGYRRQDRREWYAFDPHERMQQQLQHFKTLIKQLQEGKRPRWRCTFDASRVASFVKSPNRNITTYIPVWLKF